MSRTQVTEMTEVKTTDVVNAERSKIILSASGGNARTSERESTYGACRRKANRSRSSCLVKLSRSPSGMIDLGIS